MSTITWQTKQKIVVTYPSQLVETSGATSRDIFQAGRISINRGREQRTINTIAEARKGFTTVERDYTITMTMYETDENLVHMESLYATNEFFDLAIAAIDDSNTVTEKDLREWQIVEFLALGCKIESSRVTYDPMMLPVREYTIKFLKTSKQFLKEGSEPITEGDGLYWEVNIQW